jgi:hypothetical protein
MMLLLLMLLVPNPITTLNAAEKGRGLRRTKHLIKVGRGRDVGSTGLV